MSSIADLEKDLRLHHTLCQQILALVEKETAALRGSDFCLAAPEFHQRRKHLLPQLEQSVERVRLHRHTWQQLPPAARALHPQITPLLQLVQDLIMKILVLDRENEQLLLRKGLLPSAHLP